MKEAYLKYYETSSPFRAQLHYMLDACLQKKNIRKLALMNRQKDYANLARQPELFDLHKELNALLLEGVQNWKGYDYGEGYFYQSFKKIGLRGFRDTEARVAAMDLEKRVAGKTVLEIGSNSGFLSCQIAPYAREVVGFDIAPYLINISRVVASYLGIRNVSFDVCAFEDFKTDRKFDFVLSFANHSTYDGNTRQSQEEFFGRCAALCQDDGYLLFESHPPGYESAEQVDHACKIIEDRFVILERKILNYGTFLDQGRTFVIAQPKK